MKEVKFTKVKLAERRLLNEDERLTDNVNLLMARDRQSDAESNNTGHVLSFPVIVCMSKIGQLALLVKGNTSCHKLNLFPVMSESVLTVSAI